MFMFSSVSGSDVLFAQKIIFCVMCEDLASPALNFCLHCEHCGPTAFN